MSSLCVFLGSSRGARAEYADAARSLGTELAARGIGLVYGGGSIGLMAVLADAVLAAGGEVVGVIPQALVDHEVAHHGLTELIITPSMHARKAEMARRADAFAALPGGIGTLEELFEVWTWTQLGIFEKPCGLLNVAGYYDQLAGFLDHMAAERFVRPEHRGLLMMEHSPGELLDALQRWEPPIIEKWIGLDQS